MEKNPKKMLVILGIIVVIVIILIVAAMKSKKAPENTGNPEAGQVQTQEEPGASETQSTSTPSTNANAIEGVGEIVNLKDAVAVVPGGPNLVTKDNKVVTEEGRVAANDAPPMSAGAPKQTGFLDKATLAPSVIQLNVGNNVFSPNSFTTNAGAPTTISLTGVDSYSHVFTFSDASLSAIAMLVGPGQTKAITFNAPVNAGAYAFHCDSPDHAARGEAGNMIVK
jgi:plastocyanin